MKVMKITFIILSCSFVQLVSLCSASQDEFSTVQMEAFPRWPSEARWQAEAGPDYRTRTLAASLQVQSCWKGNPPFDRKKLVELKASNELPRLIGMILLLFYFLMFTIFWLCKVSSESILFKL